MNHRLCCCSAERPWAGSFAAALLRDLASALRCGSERGAGYWARRDEATAWLDKHARERAGTNGLRCFKVVYSQRSRMPVRTAPSRGADICGSRATGDEVLVEEVVDGWVRLSPLDTYAGWVNFDAERGGPCRSPPKEMWMLIEAADVGTLLVEVVLDQNGHEVDDEAWMPDVC